MSVDLAAYRAAGLADLAGWLRAGRTTPTELAALAASALERFAAPLNAVVLVCRERAAAEAAVAEAAPRAGRGRLHGIPYGAKDLLATRDLPTTWGAAPFRQQTFDEDATVIRRLRAAGAVLVAKLAMVELAGGAGYRQPNASLTGPGLNPWHPGHWAGGSSSGSAAAVAVGALPYAIGSETWGSILLPAAFCGVVGLRPTYGLVSRHGAMALAWSMDKIGPLARSVADCATVLAAIAGPDAADPTSVHHGFRYRPARFVGWRPRFGIVVDEFVNADPALAPALAAAQRSLATLGTCVEVRLPDLPYQEVARLTIAAEMAAAFSTAIDAGQLAELTAPEDRVTPYVYQTLPASDYLNAQRLRGRIGRALTEALAGVDLLVAPTTPSAAPAIRPSLEQSGHRRPAARLSAASNLAGLPAVSLPVGLAAAGLPVGLQLVGPAFAEEPLVAAAAAVERALGWVGRPPDVGPPDPSE